MRHPGYETSPNHGSRSQSKEWDEALLLTGRGAFHLRYAASEWAGFEKNRRRRPRTRIGGGRGGVRKVGGALDAGTRRGTT